MDISGKALIAAPSLLDPNFRQTVVLIVEHAKDEGSFGLVLNRPGPMSVADYCAGLGIDWAGPADEPVRIGGPVQPASGWLLHEACPELPNAKVVLPGLCMSNTREALEIAAGLSELRRHIFAGYAGWGAGQLGYEMLGGSWLTVDVDVDLVFGTKASRMWRRAMSLIGIDPLLLVPGAPERC